MSADERTAPPNRTILQCDVLQGLAQIADGTIDCVVTSPPYYQLRVYHGTDVGDQWGTEPDVETYLRRVDALFDELRRILKPTGTVWFNIGDVYSSGTPSGAPPPSKRPDPKQPHAPSSPWHGARHEHVRAKSLLAMPHRILVRLVDQGWLCRNDIIWHKLSALPASMKDRLTNVHEHLFLLTREPRYYFDLDAIRVPHKGGPENLAFNLRVREALYGRLESKPHLGHVSPGEMETYAMRNAAPGRQVCLDAPDETAADPRVLRAMQRRSVAYDARVIDGKPAEPDRVQPLRVNQKGKAGEGGRHPDGRPFNDPKGKNPGDVVAAAPMQTIRDHYGNHRPDGTPINDPRGKNPGDVQSFRRTFDRRGTHVATFPESLADWCIRAGCPKGGMVLDPFLGSGTTAVAAEKTGRLWCGIELSPEYVAEAWRRLAPYQNERVAPLPEVTARL